jgi:hypothetical protein
VQATNIKGSCFGTKHLKDALAECDLVEDVRYGNAKAITSIYERNPGKAQLLAGMVEVRTRKKRGGDVLSQPHSKKSSATQPESDNDLLENEEPPREESDAEIDLLDEPTSEGDLTAVELGAYAKYLRCEPAAVVDALRERIKDMAKVACQPLLTLANSLGCDISAEVKTSYFDCFSDHTFTAGHAYRGC